MPFQTCANQPFVTIYFNHAHHYHTSKFLCTCYIKFKLQKSTKAERSEVGYAIIEFAYQMHLHAFYNHITAVLEKQISSWLQIFFDKTFLFSYVALSALINTLHIKLSMKLFPLKFHCLSDSIALQFTASIHNMIFVLTFHLSI